jgi:hypothetical protein
MHDSQNAPALRNRLADLTYEHPLLGVVLGLLANLLIIALLAYYPAQWLGLW